MTAGAVVPPRTLRSGELAVVLLLPIALINAIGFILPVLNLARFSFNKVSIGGGIEDVFTWENWLGLLTDKFYLELVFNSVWISLAITLTTLIVGRVIMPIWRNVYHRFRVAAVVPESDNVVSVHITGRTLDKTLRLDADMLLQHVQHRLQHVQHGHAEPQARGFQVVAQRLVDHGGQHGAGFGLDPFQHAVQLEAGPDQAPAVIHDRGVLELRDGRAGDAVQRLPGRVGYQVQVDAVRLHAKGG